VMAWATESLTRLSNSIPAAMDMIDGLVTIRLHETDRQQPGYVSADVHSSTIRGEDFESATQMSRSLWDMDRLTCVTGSIVNGFLGWRGDNGAMPMTEDSLFGTNIDGTKNEDYCCYCYQEGRFTSEETTEEMIEICIPPHG
jgi:hypothetical protein